MSPSGSTIGPSRSAAAEIAAAKAELKAARVISGSLTRLAKAVQRELEKLPTPTAQRRLLTGLREDVEAALGKVSEA